ncbi:MAG: hypothetical protein EOP62_00710 [Sphingomonadales bacterium]|nr:MAG: hypothetical protein EOP62_00710 [Sphingomonadales bacterium]
MHFRSILMHTALTGIAFCAATAHAQTDVERIQSLESRLEAQDARIAELERLLRSAAAIAPAAPVTLAAPAASVAAPVVTIPLNRPGAHPVISPPIAVAAEVAPAAPRLLVSGDFRLREEFNWSDEDAADRNRTVMRARLRASYAVNDLVTVGTQISTGDPGDPNSTDLTVSDFVNDLTVSLDQAFARVNLGNLTLWGGKFADPFRRTDLVWDGDVNPQGVAATYRQPLAEGATLDARALYFILNESVAGTGSDMLGGQLSLTVPVGQWGIELSGGYYDYRLRSIAGADAGDFRSNLLRPDGTYLSDFNLGDVIATATWHGLGESWPIGILGEYVHNFGSARKRADDGYSVELFAGRVVRQGDWRFGYNYAESQNESVLAAFSHDNLGFATNYKLHALTVDHVLMAGTILNLTAYRYKPLDPLYAGANQPNDWLNRVRLNLLFNF